jgi:hypothetical protein
LLLDDISSAGQEIILFLLPEEEPAIEPSVLPKGSRNFLHHEFQFRVRTNYVLLPKVTNSSCDYEETEIFDRHLNAD